MKQNLSKKEGRKMKNQSILRRLITLIGLLVLFSTSMELFYQNRTQPIMNLGKGKNHV